MNGKATDWKMDCVFLPYYSPFHYNCCFCFVSLSFHYCVHCLILVVVAPADKQGKSCAGLAMELYNLSDINDYMASVLLQIPAQIYLCRLDSVNRSEDAFVLS
ncbi:hypothetical protein OIU78_003725 [Salix suchowensis]|nr:hypothetical protein OIU78_003725 [Salix suchowensis]